MSRVIIFVVTIVIHVCFNIYSLVTLVNDANVIFNFCACFNGLFCLVLAYWYIILTLFKCT